MTRAAELDTRDAIQYFVSLHPRYLNSLGFPAYLGDGVGNAVEADLSGFWAVGGVGSEDLSDVVNSHGGAV